MTLFERPTPRQRTPLPAILEKRLGQLARMELRTVVSAAIGGVFAVIVSLGGLVGLGLLGGIAIGAWTRLVLLGDDPRRRETPRLFWNRRR